MLKVGIVGLGHIGKKHINAVERLEEVSIIGISDIQKPASDIPYFETLDQLCNNKEIDLISVCTPNYLHKEHAIKVLESGKHAICEKPFALNQKDCEDILNASLKNGKHIFCVMQNRFSPVSQWLKSIITDEVLGDILMVNVACYWNRDERYYTDETWKGSKNKDGGTLFTQFAHYIDTLYHLFGTIEITSGTFENFTHKNLTEFEDSGVFSFKLDKGGIGSFQYSTSAWDKNFESTLTIIGSKGTIKVAGQYMDQVIYAHGASLDGIPSLEKNDNIGNLANIYKNAHQVINGTAKVNTTALDGMKVVSLIASIYSFKS